MGSGTIPVDINPAGELKLQELLTASSDGAAPISGYVNFRKWFLQHFHTQRAPHAHDCDLKLENFALYFFNEVRTHTFVHLRSTKSVNESNKSEKVPPESVQEQKRSRQRSNAKTLEELPQLEISNFPVLGTASGSRGTITHVQARNASTPTRKSLNQSGQQQPKHGNQNQRRSTESVSKSFLSTPSNNSSFEKSRNSTTGDGGGGSMGGSNSFCLADFIISPTANTNSNSRQSQLHKKKMQSNSTPSTPNSSSSSIKPKKRVVPLSISKTVSSTALPDNGPFGANSSFSQENNILKLAETAVVVDYNKRAVEESLRALKNDLFEVNSIIKAASTPVSTPTKNRGNAIAEQKITKGRSNEIKSSNIYNESSLIDVTIEIEKIPNKIVEPLKILANIYALLLDMNLTTNILQEYSFLLNLLNSNMPIKNDLKRNEEDSKSEITTHTHTPPPPSPPPPPPKTFELLKDVVHSIFFAKCVLEEQQKALSLIDTKSLGVVLQCERLLRLSPSLKNRLSSAYAQKQSRSLAFGASFFDFAYENCSIKNVCFQEDSDSRKFFHNNCEFVAFRKQRDLFYAALKIWENCHLHPTWNFKKEIEPKIREIFRQSENPVNMAHFTKLFVSQLIISSTERTTPEDVGIDLESSIDLEKFNKLSQRLVAPSNFSVDYQFPREQAFFRDFIIESRSIPFMEHLKIVLAYELSRLNDTDLEELNPFADDANATDYHECYEDKEFMIRPSVLGSMLILAKFLGLTIALPFQIPSCVDETFSSAIMTKRQYRLRRFFQPPINVFEIVDASARNGRYLITLPWVVQYLVMLDDVTFLLDDLSATIHKLYDIYMSLGNDESQVTSTSAFIVRCCLGWLFEQKPQIGAKYLRYRTVYYENNVKLRSKTEHPVLESILCVACPFLAEFRVAIMPAAKCAIAKNVSRSGRFRHITPCIAAPKPRLIDQHSTNTASNTPQAQTSKETSTKNRQKLLMECFLQSQNSSTQRLISFLTERVYKCVVRDAQYKILLPIKTGRDKRINKITSTNQKIVLDEVIEICQREMHAKWDIEVSQLLNERTVSAVEALLPIETAAAIKKAYTLRIKTVAKSKIEQWAHVNLYRNDDFYCCNDINELATQLCNANANRPTNSTDHHQTTELKLVQKEPRISDIIEEMQHWLYTTGNFQTKFKPGIWSWSHDTMIRHDDTLIEFLHRVKISFENTLPTIYYRLIGSGLVQLLQHLIANSPLSMTDALIRKICEFFANTKMRSADVPSTSPTPSSPSEESEDITTKTREDDSGDDDDDECSDNDGGSSEHTTPTTLTKMKEPPAATTIYHGLITAPFVQSLGSCPLRYDKLKKLICSLIEHDCITMNFVNETFVNVFKEELSANVFNAVSKMLYDIAQKSSSKANKVTRDKSDNNSDISDNENLFKSKLFMEVLADLAKDLDDF